MSAKGNIDRSAEILKDLMDDYVSGKLTYNRFAFDAIVLDIDDKGKKFTEDNPVDSIRFRHISDSRDRYYTDENTNIAWPWLGIHTRPPLKIGERVKILYEWPKSIHPYWIPARHSNDNANFKAWNDVVAPSEPSAAEAFGDPSNDDDKPKEPTANKISQQNNLEVLQDPDVKKKEVKTFHKAHDEYIVQGSSDSLIRFGRDRHKEVGSGYDDAGCIDVLVGVDSEEPSWDVAARDYTSQKSDIDEHLSNPSDVSTKGASAKVLSADVVRIRAKKNLVVWLDDGIYISVADGKITIGGTKDTNNKTGQMLTENSVCRHVCPFVRWSLNLENKGTDLTSGLYLSAPSLQVAAMGLVDGIVESKFSATAGKADATEGNSNIVVKD